METTKVLYRDYWEMSKAVMPSSIDGESKYRLQSLNIGMYLYLYMNCHTEITN